MPLTATVSSISLSQAGLYAILGYAVVFFGLILLMLVMVILGKCFTAKLQTKATRTTEALPAKLPEPPAAPGSAGSLKLYNVEPKTAAMVMAIVADSMGKPINELRFLSIQEVTE